MVSTTYEVAERRDVSFSASCFSIDRVGNSMVYIEFLAGEPSQPKGNTLAAATRPFVFYALS